MFEKAFEVFFLLQILLRASSATDQESVIRVISGVRTDEINKDNAEVQQLNYVSEKEQKNSDDGEEVQVNAPDDNNVVSNDQAPNGKIQKLRNANIPKSQQKRWGKEGKKKKPSSLEFKYAVAKKDEAGFDLNPEDIKKLKIWKEGVIPYYIDVVSFSDKVLRDKIRNFLHMVNSVTSVNFVELPGPPSDDNERWVFFMNRRGLLGCADHSVKNFSNQGVQRVVLGYDCMATRGEIAEAVMSIVGVPAQHNAPDRDKYIKVNLENVMPEKKYLFEKLNDNEWIFHDLAYDFNSITHYDIHKHSSNGRPTIELKETSEDLNPVIVLSPIDLQKIKLLYNYITRNKKIQTPVCEKLFKISSKFRPGPISNKNIKICKKPGRYTGTIDSNDLKSLEETEDKNTNETGVVIKDEKYEYSNSDKEKNTDDEEIRADSVEKKYKVSGNANKKEKDNLDTENIDAETPIIKEQLKHEKPKSKDKNKHTNNVDLLQQLSDYDSNEEYKRVPLNYRIRLKKVDPLLVLSDYQTVEERR